VRRNGTPLILFLVYFSWNLVYRFALPVSAFCAPSSLPRSKCITEEQYLSILFFTQLSIARGIPQVFFCDERNRVTDKRRLTQITKSEIFYH